MTTIGDGLKTLPKCPTCGCERRQVEGGHAAGFHRLGCKEQAAAQERAQALEVEEASCEEAI